MKVSEFGNLLDMFCEMFLNCMKYGTLQHATLELVFEFISVMLDTFDMLEKVVTGNEENRKISDIEKANLFKSKALDYISDIQNGIMSFINYCTREIMEGKAKINEVSNYGNDTQKG